MPSIWTVRELAEVQHALYYLKNLDHGTTGHNQLCIIAKMAGLLGISLSEDGALDIGDCAILAAVELTSTNGDTAIGEGINAREVY